MTTLFVKFGHAIVSELGDNCGRIQFKMGPVALERSGRRCVMMAPVILTCCLHDAGRSKQEVMDGYFRPQTVWGGG